MFQLFQIKCLWKKVSRFCDTCPASSRKFLHFLYEIDIDQFNSDSFCVKNQTQLLGPPSLATSSQNIQFSAKLFCGNDSLYFPDKVRAEQPLFLNMIYCSWLLSETQAQLYLFLVSHTFDQVEFPPGQNITFVQAQFRWFISQ